MKFEFEPLRFRPRQPSGGYGNGTHPAISSDVRDNGGELSGIITVCRATGTVNYVFSVEP